MISATTPHPEDVVFHVLSFEGPDAYSRAGGLASRIAGLTDALADAGFETHLWFVGDPALPGHESRGRLVLHRWCQWISDYHTAGVYDGEESKERDFTSSLPPLLMHKFLLPHLRTGRRAVVLAEEWHTAGAVIHLDHLLRRARRREAAAMQWNANNLFGFERIDWGRLAQTVTITTVSRYMRQRMWNLGVDPLVVPNGLSSESLQPPERSEIVAFHQRVGDRPVLTKVARWDPDKRWFLAVDTAAELKRCGYRPLLIARGGVEAHGTEVLARAAALGLRVAEKAAAPGARGLLQSLAGLREVDILNLQSPLDGSSLRLLFRGSGAVLANSGHEPFGLVGLETMAASGIACVGGTGEDYAVPGWNSLLLQTSDPREFLCAFRERLADASENRAIRQRAHATARGFTWAEIVRRDLLSRFRTALAPDAVERRPTDVEGRPTAARPWRSSSRRKAESVSPQRSRTSTVPRVCDAEARAESLRSFEPVVGA